MINKIESKDKYIWLEKDSSRTRSWIHAQEKISKQYFSDLKSGPKLEPRFRELFDADAELLPTIMGSKYFYRARKKGEDEPSLYLKRGYRGKAELLINPKKLKFGTIQDWVVSKDAKYIAIGFSISSNDRQVIKIFEVKSKKFLADTISSERYPYFQAWDLDSSGFWYTRGEEGHPSNEEKYYKCIYYHVIGQPVSRDKIFFRNILERGDWPSLSLSSDGKYQIVMVDHIDFTSTIYFKNTQVKGSDFVNITKDMKALSSARAENGFIYLKTNYNASNRKILRRKITKNGLGKWEVFVKESKYKLESSSLFKKYIILEYIENVSSKVYLLNLKTKKIKNIVLPGVGCLEGMSGEYEGNELFFSFSSLNKAPCIFKLNLRTLKQSLHWKSEIKIPKLFVKQEWSVSKDGTRVPMFILRSNKKMRAGPTLVYAYGGFDISYFPHFWSSVIPFVEKGGTFILANIRGGGEFGKKWHEAVLKTKQHKRFEDFASVLDHLIDKKHTTPSQLAVWGGSNGGLLMSVMALHYPHLFKVALIGVPVTDMLRFHLFYGGRWWINEYGDPENKKMRKYLLSYSPYHNVENKEYPSMLLTTSEHDDRVHPMHTFKFLAKLRENKKQKNPIILMLERKAGHGGAGKVSADIKRFSAMFAFLFKELGMNEK